MLHSELIRVKMRIGQGLGAVATTLPNQPSLWLYLNMEPRQWSEACADSARGNPCVTA